MLLFLSAGACSSQAGQIEGVTASQGASTETCSAKWTQAARYTPGRKVSFRGVNYEAAFASVGQSPQTASSIGKTALVWHRKGLCEQSTEAGNGDVTSSSGAASGTSADSSASGNSTLPISVTAGPNFILSPYKDLSVNANWNSLVISTSVTGTQQPLLSVIGDAKAVTWAFATGECGAETWGGINADQLATNNVAQWVAAKKGYIISTGGASGSFTCGTDAGFTTFLDRYDSDYLLGVDFDIEAGQTKAILDSLVARIKAAQQLPKYSKLRFSFTLATLAGNTPASLGSAGITTLQSITDGGLTNYTINLMVMDYGSALATNCVLSAQGTCDMGLSATQAAANLNAAYAVPFEKIELTPMIGGNDAADETFTLDDVQIVLQYAAEKNLAGVHYWSFDRDTDCVQASASPVCNSYGKPGSAATAGTLGFMKQFLEGITTQ